MKICKDCGFILPKVEFSKRKDSADRLSYVCKECYKIRYTKYRASKHGLCNTIYNNQIGHSKFRKHKHPEYSFIQLKNWILSQSNFSELYDNWVKSGYNIRLAPSVDRLIDSESYNFNNIRLVTWKENNEKSFIYLKNYKKK